MMEPIHLYIRELERRLLKAMCNSDLEELDALLADDLVFTDHLGALWGKQDDLDAHRSGAINVRAVEASQERVRVLNEAAAAVSVRLSISGTFGGEEASGVFRFTRVWERMRDGRWQVVVAQSTLVADDSGGAHSGDSGVSHI